MRTRGEKARWARGRGSALILALWSVLLLSLLVASLTFDMHVEAAITSHRRRRTRAELHARSGLAYAQWLLSRRQTVTETTMPEGIDEESYRLLLRLRRNLPVRRTFRWRGGVEFDLVIEPENSRRNVNALDRSDWQEILRRGGVPEAHRDALIDAFLDWVDADDLTRLAGAEKDDPFYVERGYEPRNAPVETVAELALIKGFSEALLHGGPSPWDENEILPGIAEWLTAQGDGRLYAPAATRETLLTIPEMTESEADAILEAVRGPDGVEGTEDDGFADPVEFAALTGIVTPAVWQRLTFEPAAGYRVVATGRSGRVRHRVEVRVRVTGERVVVVEWSEGL